MLPSRESRYQNNYFDKPPEMLAVYYKELGEQAVRTFDLYTSLMVEREAVGRAIVENGGQL